MTMINWAGLLQRIMDFLSARLEAQAQAHADRSLQHQNDAIDAEAEARRHTERAHAHAEHARRVNRLAGRVQKLTQEDKPGYQTIGPVNLDVH